MDDEEKTKTAIICIYYRVLFSLLIIPAAIVHSFGRADLVFII